MAFLLDSFLKNTSDVETSIHELNVHLERNLNGKIFIACAGVTGILTLVSFNFFILFAVYLAATILFATAWAFNQSNSYLSLTKWMAWFGMSVSAFVTIFVSGGLNHPSSAWLIVLLLATGTLRDTLLNIVNVVVVLLFMGVLFSLQNSEFLQSITIDGAVQLGFVHQVLQLLYSAFAIYIFTNIRGSQRGTLIRVLTELRTLNEELKAAERTADQANRVKTMFLSNMSHEIRTPLNGLNGMLTLLLEHEGLDDKAKEYLHVAYDSNKRLLELANNILNISRIEAHAMTLNYADIDLMTVFEKEHNGFRNLACAKGLQFNWFVHLNSNWVFADGERLGEILHHLCDNAIKYTHTGRVSVHIDQIQFQGSMMELQIMVVDTGIGMDLTLLDHYLSPFTQASMDYNREFQGLGLGLALVNQLLVLMNGTLEVQSERNRGSQFLVKIPLEMARDYHEDNSPKASIDRFSPVTASLEFDVGRRQLLLVEDDLNNVRLLQVLLRDYDVDIHVAHSGQEAIDLLNQLPRCDLMFIDMYMPIMNGLDAMIEIRKNPQWKHLNTVVVTGSKDEQVLARWQELGVKDVLPKPIPTSEFEFYVEKYLPKASI